MSRELTLLASIFSELCEAENIGLSKTAFIRRINKGYWGVFSKKNKLLGKYKTKEEAVKRLDQIEWFKHHKKNASKNITYTELLRSLNKKYPAEIVREFRKIFKDAFDDALLNGEKNPEEFAMQEAVKFVDELGANLAKTAAAIDMGEASYAGKFIAQFIKFLMRKISIENRPKALNNLKNKIYLLNENELAAKKMPASSAIGQAISLTKNLLMTHSPQYIREVLNSIAGNL